MDHETSDGSGADYEPGRLGKFLSALWIGAFFSFVPIYLTVVVVPQMRPMHLMFALGGALMLGWLRPSFWRHQFDAMLPAWIGAYSLLCLLWFILFGGGDPEALRLRLVAMAFLLVTYVVVNAGTRATEIARRTILVVVLFSVAVNVFDISNPFVMTPLGNEFALLGRAAGFYVNPNQAGFALGIGFVLTIGMISGRWRAWYLAYVACGVALTLSRSAMLGFVIVVLALWMHRVLTTRQVITAAFMGMLAGMAVALMLLPVLSEQFGLDPAFIVDRLLWIVDPEGRADFSQTERIFLADKGWQQFLMSPTLGNGLGSTELWVERSSTHNTYVMLLSDFGLIGILPIPALLLAIASGPRARLVPERWAFVVGILVACAFSHGVLYDYYFLVGFAVMAAMCRPSAITSAIERKSGTGYSQLPTSAHT